MSIKFNYDDEYLKEVLRIVFEDPLLYKVPKGVIRYDYVNTHGWWVRVVREGVRFRKFFSDGVHGSIEEALRKAIIDRHETLSAFTDAKTNIHYSALALEPENRISLKVETRNNKQYYSWEARWYDENFKVKKRGFAIRKYGDEEAKALALAEATKNHNGKLKITSFKDLYIKDVYKEISRFEVEVESTINGESYSKNNNSSKDIEIEDPYGFEGSREYVLHVSIERNKKLREQKIKQFIDKHGKLFCELCSFRFVEKYSFLCKEIIEVHHIVPLSTLNESSKTTLSDLMLLCANCHLAIHQGCAEDNLLVAQRHN